MAKDIKTLIFIFIFGVLFNLQSQAETLVWQEPKMFELNFDKPGTYESPVIFAESVIKNVTVNWGFQGEVKIGITTNGGRHYSSVINGVKKKEGFMPGTFLRYKAYVGEDSHLSWVKLVYEDASGKFYTFGNPQLTGFLYRRKIYIVGSKENLSNYPVRIKTENIKGSVRFTSADGETSLAYYREEIEDGEADVFWVKVPQIPKRGVNIYIYYGNEQAEDLSRGEDVFVFFDDFKGEELNEDKWNFMPDLKGQGYVKKEKFFLKDGVLAANNFLIGDDVQIEFKAGTGSQHADIQAVLDDIVFYSSSFPGAEHAIAKGGQVKVNQSLPFNKGEDYVYSIKRFNKEMTFSRYNEFSRGEIFNDISSVKMISGSVKKKQPLKLKSAAYHNSEQGVFFDWVRARFYMEPDPGVLSFGEEEIVNMVQEVPNGYVSQNVPTKFPVRVIAVKDCPSEAVLDISADGGKNYLRDVKQNTYYYASKKDFICGQDLYWQIKIKEGSEGDRLSKKISLDYFPGKITLISPNGEEILEAGLKQEIIWSAQEYEESYLLSLRYSLDEGKTYNVIVDGMSNTGHYSWYLPKNLKGKILIKISDFYDSEIFDISDEFIEVRERR